MAEILENILDDLKNKNIRRRNIFNYCYDSTDQKLEDRKKLGLREVICGFEFLYHGTPEIPGEEQVDHVVIFEDGFEVSQVRVLERFKPLVEFNYVLDLFFGEPLLLDNQNSFLLLILL